MAQTSLFRHIGICRIEGAVGNVGAPLTRRQIHQGMQAEAYMSIHIGIQLPHIGPEPFHGHGVGAGHGIQLRVIPGNGLAPALAVAYLLGFLSGLRHGFIKHRQILLHGGFPAAAVLRRDDVHPGLGPHVVHQLLPEAHHFLCGVRQHGRIDQRRNQNLFFGSYLFNMVSKRLVKVLHQTIPSAVPQHIVKLIGQVPALNNIVIFRSELFPQIVEQPAGKFSALRKKGAPAVASHIPKARFHSGKPHILRQVQSQIKLKPLIPAGIQRVKQRILTVIYILPRIVEARYIVVYLIGFTVILHRILDYQQLHSHFLQLGRSTVPVLLGPGSPLGGQLGGCKHSFQQRHFILLLRPCA